MLVTPMKAVTLLFLTDIRIISITISIGDGEDTLTDTSFLMPSILMVRVLEAQKADIISTRVLSSMLQKIMAAALKNV